MYRIIAHPGTAHRDDFLAVSILLETLGTAEVYRQEPTRQDLDDPNTYIVDVGMEYDPEKHNFDHHHDHSLPCAFHLVMKHLGYHTDARLMFGWYCHMSMLGVRCTYKTAEPLGVDTSVLFAASSPIEGYILARFSQAHQLLPEDMLYKLMKDLGHELLALMKQKKARLARLKEEVKILPVKHLKAIASTIADNPKLSMELFLRYLDDDSIVMSITPSVRGPGWEMLRLKDFEIVDFRAIADNPEVRFVHANGFVAKTRSLIPLEAVIRLAAAAVADA